MTRSERTQLAWIGFAALSMRRRRGSPAIFTRVLVSFVLFALACFAAGAVLELIHRAV